MRGWHRYAQCATDHDTPARLAELRETADAHGHENRILHNISDAADETRRLTDRANAIKSKNAPSYVSAGFGERQVYAPLISCGMYEGEVFQIMEQGEELGVRLIFVGTAERFELLPFGLRMKFDNEPLSGDVCLCASGF